jgi:hypothetical protein
MMGDHPSVQAILLRNQTKEKEEKKKNQLTKNQGRSILFKRVIGFELDAKIGSKGSGGSG